MIQRSISPTLSDGTQSKRPLNIDEEIGKREKIQKLRRLDSPTSPNEKNYVQVSSPQYSPSDKDKTSPKIKTVKGEKRSVSPKAMYPPSIQKYLNGKNNLSIEEAIEKLKSPTNKTHKGNLEKMKLLGQLQTQEIESNIMFRKAYSNSTTSVSPAHSGSSMGSPKLTSPKRENTSSMEGEGNIVITFEESFPAISPPKNMHQGGGNNSGNNYFNQGQQQQGFYNSNNGFPNQMGHQNQNFQMNNQGNFMNFQGQGQGQYNQSQQGIQFNQYNQQQQPFYNNQFQAQHSNFEVEEPRDRTTSFLMDSSNLGFMNQTNMGGNSQDTKWMVQNQINTIQSLVSTKKTTSPSEPNRGLVHMFQKRNSNPENIIRNPTSQPLLSQKNPLFGPGQGGNTMMQNFNNRGGGGFQNINSQQGSQFNGGNVFQDFNTGNMMNGNFNGNLQSQLNPHQLQQKLFETGMVEQGISTNHNFGVNQMTQQNQGFGFGNDMNNNWNNSYQNNREREEKIEEMPDSFDPASFFSLNNNNKEADFDMNIIQSEVGFIPKMQTYDPMEEQLILPESLGMEGFLSQSYGGLKFN